MPRRVSRREDTTRSVQSEAVELTEHPGYSSVTAPLSFSTVITSYTAFEMLG